MKKLRVNLGERSYDILIGKGIRKDLGKHIKEVFNGKKIAIITDKNVHKIYKNIVKDSLEKLGFNIKFIVIKPGEKSKSFDSLSFIYNQLLDFELTRSDLIITLGGGVVGDLGGFVASTYLRGVDFVQVPTSLLAQVDSSVGGKVGVDLERGKNLVGSFYHPKRVIIDTEVLNTLKPKYFNDGLGEVIKYGCIRDEYLFKIFEDVKDKSELITNLDYIIFNCCDIKRAIVENDEKDTGERMVLNFGHTLGHAVEKMFNFEEYTHGEAVAIGMYMITKISEELNITERGTTERIKKVLEKFQLPYEVNIENKKELIESIKLDKKNLNNILNLILLKEIGMGFIYKTDLDFFKGL